jgi:hypothetical protein
MKELSSFAAEHQDVAIVIAQFCYKSNSLTPPAFTLQSVISASHSTMKQTLALGLSAAALLAAGGRRGSTALYRSAATCLQGTMPGSQPAGSSRAALQVHEEEDTSRSCVSTVFALLPSQTSFSSQPPALVGTRPLCVLQ